MLEFEIQRSERRCSVSDRELKPGEMFYSAIIDADGELNRLDFSDEHWKGAPENCVGWWKTQVPTLASLKMKWAPNDVMLHYFERLLEDPAKADVAYVLSLLMMRRRILAEKGVTQDTLGMEQINYFCPKNEKNYSVMVTPLHADRIEVIQAELAELLYCPTG